MYDPSYIVLTAGLVCLGIYKGLWNPPLNALFADAVPTGERAKWFTIKYIALAISGASGPLLAVALFIWVGNHWSMQELKTVFLVGILMSLPFAIMLFYLKEHGREEEEIAPLLASSPVDEDYITEDEAFSYKIGNVHIRQRHIPLIAAISDVISGLASGMTIKFFPLFFENECLMSPIMVSVIMGITPLLIAANSHICQKASNSFGRIQISLFVRVIGVSLLLVMTFLKSSWRNYWIIVPIYVVRTVFMNSTSPLIRSIVMDYSPKHNRGKWSSIESITSFGWSGSAYIGGILTDKYGYGGSFLGTAILQFLAGLILCFLLPLVPLEKKLENKLSENIEDSDALKVSSSSINSTLSSRKEAY
jgi:MFS family permease